MSQLPKSNSEFLKTLFGEGWGEIPVSSGKDAWGVMPAKSAVDLFMPTMPNYFCVSVFHNDGGRFRRKKEIFKRQNIFVIDDIGTKLDEDAASLLYPPPTYKLETSPGNYQWGYVIKGGLDDMRKSDALVDAVIGASLLNPSGKDPGMAGVTRVVRLPFGANLKAKVIEANGGKPFLCRLTHWTPKVAYDLPTLAAAFGADLSDEALESRRTAVLSGEATPEEIEGDFILKLFRARGMISDDSRSDSGFIAVECPWAAEHTDARSEAGYRPGLGGFQCHHGHCQHRTMEDLRRWAAEAITPEEKAEMARAAFAEPIDANDVEGAVAAAQEVRDESALGVALREYVYVVAQDAIGDRRTGRMFSRSAFNALMTAIAPAGASGKKSAFAKFMNAGAKSVDNVTYAPGEPPIVRDRETGERLLNRWRPGMIAPHDEAVIDQDICVYLDHVRMIFHDDKVRETFLDWAAYLIQNPGKKINWAFLVIGGQGSGKDLILAPIVRLLGTQNCRTLSDSALESQFNDWLENQLLIIGELPSFRKKDFYDRLKMFVSTGQDKLTVNRKNMQPYQIENFQCWFMFSNHADALALERDDRRILVYRTEAKRRAPDYFEKLAKALGDGAFLGKLFRYLLDRDVSKFKPFAPPPETEAKREMVENARDPLAGWIADLFAEGGAFHGRRLVTPGEIAAHGRFKASMSALPHKLKERATDERAIGQILGDALHDLAPEKLGRYRVRDGKGPEPVWTLGGGAALFRQIKELRDAYKRDKDQATERRAAESGEGDVIDAAEVF